ncbi:MAG: PD-(D/E)XK nuclease family protein, partial [Acidimicrobiia bacterium]|nr:PD-(D/E)XK nuclease family protein [Acidimicrobiia bacterium]
PDFVALGLDPGATAAFVADAQRMLAGYFRLEDPRAVHVIGVELRLHAEIEGVAVTGIIDRLDRLPSGDLVVVDYKTGHAPPERYEHAGLLGVDTYALLCERVFGVRPVAVRLLYVSDGVVITRRPSDRTTGFTARKFVAVWQTIERLSIEGSFAPRPSGRCEWCSYRTWCPPFGGDADEARRVGEELRAAPPGAARADATVAALVDPLPDPAPAAPG